MPAAGVDSPGQGRGWLSLQPGGPAVLGRVILTDHSQAILSAGAGGDAELISESGALGVNGRPEVSEATFAGDRFRRQTTRAPLPSSLR